MKNSSALARSIILFACTKSAFKRPFRVFITSGCAAMNSAVSFEKYASTYEPTNIALFGFSSVSPLICAIIRDGQSKNVLNCETDIYALFASME